MLQRAINIVGCVKGFQQGFPERPLDWDMVNGERWEFDHNPFSCLQSEKATAESDTEQKAKYCCVYLPDKTASLEIVRPGLTIRDLLSGVCERHGIPLAATSIYLAGSEKVSWNMIVQAI